MRLPRVRLTVRRAIGSIALIALALGLAVALSDPHDAIAVGVKNVPPGDRFACIIGDTGHGLRTLPLARPRFADPADDLGSYLQTGPRVERVVIWDGSPGLGLVRLTAGGGWVAELFDDAGSRMRGRTELFGGGRVELDMAGPHRTLRLSEDELGALGLGGVRPLW